MVSPEILALSVTAASIGFVHTLLGPDHYLPFVALSRARNWSVPKTLGITLGCGLGHVASSVLLGALGLALGWAVSGMEAFESLRGTVAGWLLLLVGLAYAGWGVHRGRSAGAGSTGSSAPGAHAPGLGHRHRHRHDLSAAVADDDPARLLPAAPTTPWILFLVFVFGPCEPLIPVLMVPASRGSVAGVAWVTGVFAVATLATMLLAVALGLLGVSRLRFEKSERWTHALAGSAVALCGLAVVMGL